MTAPCDNCDRPEDRHIEDDKVCPGSPVNALEHYRPRGGECTHPRWERLREHDPANETLTDFKVCLECEARFDVHRRNHPNAVATTREIAARATQLGYDEGFLRGIVIGFLAGFVGAGLTFVAWTAFS